MTDSLREGPANSTLGPYYTRIILGEYKRPKPFAKTDFVPKAYIFLPIPSELREDTYVNWNQDNLETVGDAFNGQGVAGLGAVALRKAGDLATGAAGLLSDVVGAIADTASPAAGQTYDRLAGGVSSLFPADRITSAIQAEVGLAPNPNPVVSFQGPDLRSYSFSWTFYPHNAKESQNVKTVVETLKARSLAQNVVSNSASILKFPNMVQVNFFPWDQGGTAPWYWSKNSIMKYKKSVIQSVNVNYAPFGTPGFFAGTNLPTTIQLSITFKEIEYMLANDWDPSLVGNQTTIEPIQQTVKSVSEVAKSVFKDISDGVASL